MAENTSMSFSRSVVSHKWRKSQKKVDLQLDFIYDYDLGISCSHMTASLRVPGNGKSGSAPKPALFSRHKPLHYFSASLIEENYLLTSILLLTCAGWASNYSICVKALFFCLNGMNFKSWNNVFPSRNSTAKGWSKRIMITSYYAPCITPVTTLNERPSYSTWPTSGRLTRTIVV